MKLWQVRWIAIKMTNHNKSLVEGLDSLSWDDLMKLDGSMTGVLVSWMVDAIDWAKIHGDYSTVCLKRRMMLEEWWQWAVIR